jgi:hypothetical protein
MQDYRVSDWSSPDSDPVGDIEKLFTEARQTRAFPLGPLPVYITYNDYIAAIDRLYSGPGVVARPIFLVG